MSTVLITGAGSGFGQGAALALADRGHHVIATTETQDQADALGGEAPQLQVEKVDITTDDVAKADGWEIDVLIDNAGAGQFGPMADVPIDIVRHLFEVNVFGTLAITQRVLAGMIPRGAGRVIIVSSIAGRITAPATGPYAMTKHALEAMGKTMRAELAPLGIDVCLLNPGPYGTGFNDRMAEAMWEWFGDKSLQAPTTDLFQMVRDFVTTDQRDPVEVVDAMVALVEAETTEENNPVPPDVFG
ncbi:MAG: SDR family NAD(P)-dependent oxidoreductase [Acidimicrobiales bacterium]|nr:SDR family NAD(P)-dependent oxidoreductase [Acidimicrobiales bacterium]